MCVCVWDGVPLLTQDVIIPYLSVYRYDPHPNTPISGSAPKDIEMWCSNDYLGMSRHPHVINTICETARKEGVSQSLTIPVSSSCLFFSFNIPRSILLCTCIKLHILVVRAF